MESGLEFGGRKLEAESAWNPAEPGREVGVPRLGDEGLEMPFQRSVEKTANLYRLEFAPALCSHRVTAIFVSYRAPIRNAPVEGFFRGAIASAAGADLRNVRILAAACIVHCHAEGKYVPVWIRRS
jgi:hypothetical protein